MYLYQGSFNSLSVVCCAHNSEVYHDILRDIIGRRQQTDNIRFIIKNGLKAIINTRTWNNARNFQ